MSSEPLNVVDEYILALLHADKGVALPGALYLQKEMYLIQRAFPDLGAELDFEPYFLGPHSSIVEDEADQLSRSGLIQTRDARISLTDSGARIAEKVVASLPQDRIRVLEEFKSLLNDLSHDELLAFVYFGYPSSDVEKESAV